MGHEAMSSKCSDAACKHTQQPLHSIMALQRFIANAVAACLCKLSSAH